MTDFPTQEEAQEVLDQAPSDPNRLEGADQDGWSARAFPNAIFADLPVISPKEVRSRKT